MPRNKKAPKNNAHQASGSGASSSGSVIQSPPLPEPDYRIDFPLYCDLSGKGNHPSLNALLIRRPEIVFMSQVNVSLPLPQFRTNLATLYQNQEKGNRVPEHQRQVNLILSGNRDYSDYYPLLAASSFRNIHVYYLLRDAKNLADIKGELRSTPNITFYIVLDTATPAQVFDTISEYPFKNEYKGRVFFLLGHGYDHISWPAWLTEVCVGFTTRPQELFSLSRTSVSTLYFLDLLHIDFERQQEWRNLVLQVPQIQVLIIPNSSVAYDINEGKARLKEIRCPEFFYCYEPESRCTEFSPSVFSPTVFTHLTYKGGWKQFVRSWLSVSHKAQPHMVIPRGCPVEALGEFIQICTEANSVMVFRDLSSEQAAVLPREFERVRLTPQTTSAAFGFLMGVSIQHLECMPNLYRGAGVLNSPTKRLTLHLPQAEATFSVWSQRWPYLASLDIALTPETQPEAVDCLYKLSTLNIHYQVIITVTSAEVNPAVLDRLRTWTHAGPAFLCMSLPYSPALPAHLTSLPQDIKMLMFSEFKTHHQENIRLLKESSPRLIVFCPSNQADLMAYLEALPDINVFTLIEIGDVFSGDLPRELPRDRQHRIGGISFTASLSTFTENPGKFIPFLRGVVPIDIPIFCWKELPLGSILKRPVYALDSDECLQLFFEIFGVKLVTSELAVLNTKTIHPHLSLQEVKELRSHSQFNFSIDDINNLNDRIQLRYIASMLSLSSPVQPKLFFVSREVGFCIDRIRPPSEIYVTQMLNEQDYAAFHPDHVIVADNSVQEIKFLAQLEKQKFMFRVLGKRIDATWIDFMEGCARGIIVHPEESHVLACFKTIDFFEFIHFSIENAQQLPPQTRQVKIHSAEEGALELLPPNVVVVISGELTETQLQAIHLPGVCAETPIRIIRSMKHLKIALLPGAENKLDILAESSIPRCVVYECSLANFRHFILRSNLLVQLLLPSVSLIDSEIMQRFPYSVGVRLAEQDIGSETPANVAGYASEALVKRPDDGVWFYRRLIVGDEYLSVWGNHLFQSLPRLQEIELDFSEEEPCREFLSLRSETDFLFVITTRTLHLWLNNQDFIAQWARAFLNANLRVNAPQLENPETYQATLKSFHQLGQRNAEFSHFPLSLVALCDALPFAQGWRQLKVAQQAILWGRFNKLTIDQKQSIFTTSKDNQLAIQQWLLGKRGDDLKELWEELFSLPLPSEGEGSGVVAEGSSPQVVSEPIYEWTVGAEVLRSDHPGVCQVHHRFYRIAGTVEFSDAEIGRRRNAYVEALAHARIARDRGQSGIKFFEEGARRRGGYPTYQTVNSEGKSEQTDEVCELKPQDAHDHKIRLFADVCYQNEQGRQLFNFSILQKKPGT